MIRIQTQTFSQQALYEQLRQANAQAGALVTFTGLVRDYNHSGKINGIELEHYEGMTERALNELANEARSRFDVLDVHIVHRVGRLQNQEPIVWVGVASSHRQPAFESASYTMDMLKKSVPLWKKEWQQGSAKWVEAKATDEEAALKWLK